MESTFLERLGGGMIGVLGERVIHHAGVEQQPLVIGRRFGEGEAEGGDDLRDGAVVVLDDCR